MSNNSWFSSHFLKPASFPGIFILLNGAATTPTGQAWIEESLWIRLFADSLASSTVTRA